MAHRPPSPETPPSPTGLTTDKEYEDITLITTQSVAETIEHFLGTTPDQMLLDDVLLELERRGFTEWVTVTPTRGHAWDVSETGDRIAEAIAEAVVNQLESLLDVGEQ